MYFPTQIKPLATRIRTFFNGEEAVTTVEYAVMLALIIALAIAGIGTVGGGNSDLWDGNADKIEASMNHGS